MNSVELFKYVVAIIGAVVAVIVIVVVSGAIYGGGGDDAAPAMEPEMAQAEAPPPVPEPAPAPEPAPGAEPAAEPVAEPAPAPEPAPAAPAVGGGNLVALLATGDAAAGAAVIVKCRSCHTLDEGGARRVGPNIWNMVGAPKGASEGYAYSEALAAAGGTWTYAELDGFLAAPRAYLPGTKMTFAGIADATERANLILHLRSLSNDPLPLPAE